MDRYSIPSTVILLLFGVACGSLSGDASAPPATMSPTSTLDRGSGAAETLPGPPLLPEDPRPRDLRIYLDAWPEERKLVLGRDVVVTFTYSHPTVTWDQTASLHHVPSMSRVDLNSAGKVAITQYGNGKGRQALERILANDPRMKLIRGLIPWE